jgi:formylglycine-generating enzyme required for sulfatase activity/serine/threonine protein kinase
VSEPEVLAGRYRLERELARGGMGVVHLAWDERFDKRIALKVATPGLVGHEEFRARFRREAKIGDLLGQRTGFVRAFDWGELSDGRLYLAMDLVADARPLDLATGALDQRLERLLRATELVAQAHEQGVIHRDLKPQNFLQGPDGAIHLTDFGLAKLLADDQAQAAGDDVTLDDAATFASLKTQSGAAFGTPHYMAPEQFEDASRVDERADVFALGVMLFQALCGQFPFVASTPRGLARAHVRVELGQAAAPRPRDHLGSVAPDLDALAAEAIAVHPDRRVADARTFARRLRAWLALSDSLDHDQTTPPATPAPALPLDRRDEPLSKRQKKRQRKAQAKREREERRPQQPREDPTPQPMCTFAHECGQRAVAGGLCAGHRASIDRQPSHPRPASSTQPKAPAAPVGGFWEEVGCCLLALLALLGAGTLVYALVYDIGGWRSAVVTFSQDLYQSVLDDPSPAAEQSPREPGPAWFERLPATQRPSTPLPIGVVFGAGPGEYVNEADGSVLVWLPAGTFVMGSRGPYRDHAGPEEDEGPAHDVHLAEGRWIGKYEVTWGQYRRFCQHGAHSLPDTPAAREAPDDHPVTEVTWDDAVAYTRWAGLRLPTEAEWEYCARGTDERLHPWGDQEPLVGAAAPARGWWCNQEGDYLDDHSALAPVGSYPAGVSPFGAHDLAGNVWEWVQDSYHDGYQGAPTDGSAWDDIQSDSPQAKRVARGGGWASNFTTLRAPNRWARAPRDTDNVQGFRVARSR